MSSQIWPKLSVDALRLVCRDVGLAGGPHKKSDMLKFLGSVDQIGLEHALEEHNSNSDSNTATAHEALAIVSASLPVKRKRGRPRKNQVGASATSVLGGGDADAETTKHKEDSAPVAPQSTSSSLQKKRKLPVGAQEDVEGTSTSRATRMRKPSLKLRESKEEEENTAMASTSAGPRRSQRVSRTAPKKPESRQQDQQGRRSEDQGTQSQVNSKTKWVFDGVVIEVGTSAWSNKPSSSHTQSQGESPTDGIECSDEDAPYEMEDDPSSGFNWDTALSVASALSQALIANGQASSATTQTSSPIEGSEKENAPPIPPQSFRELDSAHPDDEHEHVPYPPVISGQTTPAPEEAPITTVLSESQPLTIAK